MVHSAVLIFIVQQQDNATPEIYLVPGHIYLNFLKNLSQLYVYMIYIRYIYVACIAHKSLIIFAFFRSFYQEVFKKQIWEWEKYGSPLFYWYTESSRIASTL